MFTGCNVYQFRTWFWSCKAYKQPLPFTASGMDIRKQESTAIAQLYSPRHAPDNMNVKNSSLHEDKWMEKGLFLIYMIIDIIQVCFAQADI